MKPHLPACAAACVAALGVAGCGAPLPASLPSGSLPSPASPRAAASQALPPASPGVGSGPSRGPSPDPAPAPASARNVPAASPGSLRVPPAAPVPAPAAAAGGPPPMTDAPADRSVAVHAGRMTWTGSALSFTRCDGATSILRDLSPENMVTAVAVDLGVERGAIHAELYGRPGPDGVLDVAALSRATVGARCPAPGEPLPAWQAVGIEPAWAVAVADDGSLTLALPGSPPARLAAHRAQAAVASGVDASTPPWPPRESARWEGLDARGRVVALAVRPAPCGSAQSASVYGWRAELSVAGEAVRAGCAWRPR